MNVAAEATDGTVSSGFREERACAHHMAARVARVR